LQKLGKNLFKETDEGIILACCEIFFPLSLSLMADILRWQYRVFMAIKSGVSKTNQENKAK
jgi:hypothetical protein